MNKLELIKTLNNVPNDLLEIIKYKDVEFVIREIVINQIKFVTIDVKLNRFKEDLLYEDEVIRTLIPRGLCFIFADDFHVFTIYGHPKFGNKGDYNNRNLNIDNFKKIFRSKENGECAHWGAFIYEEQIFEVYGSKNVHMIVRSSNVEDDLKLYTDMRYDFALKMGSLINKYNKTLALEYLTSTGHTLCGEGCFNDSQHLIHYETTKMYFFAVTNKRNYPTDPITIISPILIDDLIIQLGLDKVLETYICNNIMESSQIEKYFETNENSEGSVVNCVDESGNLIYVYKHKNFDYVFKRALREQMKKFATTQKILRRFDNLHIVHSNYNTMVNWALNFNAYYRQGLKDDEKKLFFKNWVTQTQLFEALNGNVKLELLNKHNEYEKTQPTLEVIMFVGMPGSGKSFMARTLKKILERNNKKVIHLEQDMFYHMGKNASKHYEKSIENAIKNNDLEYLILSKSNHNDIVRKKTYQTLSKCVKNVNRTYIIMTTDNDNIIETGNLCVERVLQRGNAHTSLYEKTENEIRKIIFGTFVNQWKKLDDNESVYDIINLEINKSKIEVFNSFKQQAERFGLDNFMINNEQLNEVFNEILKEDENMILMNNKKK